tara:strand:- start:9 stop:359 length:351 start_codon:yes stop_codon:yes gene_type:complete
MKEQLFNLIKLVSGNNYRFITDKGFLIRKEDINHSVLAEHRDELNTLCAQNNMKLNHNEDQFDEKDVPSFNDDGSFKGMEKEKVYKLNRRGYEMRESIWIGKIDTELEEEALAFIG